MTARPSVAAIVPEYNEPPDAVERTVRSLVRQASVPSPIILVDDASPVPARLPADLADHVQIMRLAKNGGISVARNRAAQATTAEYLLFVNCDVTLASDWVDRAVEFMAGHPEAGAVSGAIVPRVGSPALREWRLQHIETKVHRAPGDLATEVSWIVGHVFFVRRSAYDQVGGFDHLLWLRGEDAVFCEQLTNAGYKLYHVPELLAESHEPTGPTQMAWKTVRNAGWDVWRRISEDRPASEARQLKPVRASGSMLVVFLGRFTRDLLKFRMRLLPVDLAVLACSLWLIWKTWLSSVAEGPARKAKLNMRQHPTRP